MLSGLWKDQGCRGFFCFFFPHLLYLCIILGAQAETFSLNDFKMVLTSYRMVRPRLWRWSQAAMAFLPWFVSIKGFQSCMSFQGVWIRHLIFKISEQYECSGLKLSLYDNLKYH